MIQYLGRLPYLRLRPTSRTSKHGWPTTCWNQLMTRQDLSLAPPVKLPAARKTLSSILVTHSFHQAWDHPGTLVSCLVQPVGSMIMWTKFAKMLPSVNFESILQTHDWKKIINFTLTSLLDYFNSLLCGIHGYLVSQLQRCQNNAVRIVSLLWKYDHKTPVLKKLHWLTVEQRINYKILLLAYKAQHGMAPPYVSLILSPYKHRRPL